MKFLSICSAVVLLVLSQAAVAVPILPSLSGNVEITGTSVEYADGDGNFAGISWYDVTDGTLAGTSGVGTVVIATGDFASLRTFTPATTAILNNFTVANLPATPLWLATDGVNTFSFDLTTVVVDVFNVGGAVHLLGTGVLKATGFADTAGTWDYSSQTGLSFSSITVPEPGIAALIAIGLLGFGFSRRQKKIN